MNDIRVIRDFAFEKLPVGVMVFDQRLNVILSNRKAQLFLKRHELPDDIKNICRKIFNAIKVSRLKEFFPGDIRLNRMLEGSPSQWLFQIHICEEQSSVIVYIFEESLSDGIDLNEIRGQFKLTRRETDVLRCALRGLKNTDIADELEISEHTVKDYLSSIYPKMSVESRFELRKKFASSGLGVSRHSGPVSSTG